MAPASTSMARVATAMVTAGLLCAPLALAAHSTVELVDNSEYVADSLEPLIEDTSFQEQLVEVATEPLAEAFRSEVVLDALANSGALPGFVTDQLGDLGDALLQPVLDDLVAAVQNTAGEIVASDVFAESWRTAVGDSHRSFQDALRGSGDIVIELPLRPFIELVRDDLATSGFDWLQQVPVPDVSAPLFSVEPPEQWRASYQWAALADPWLALLAVGLTGAGLWFSARRSTAWLIVGVTTPLVTLLPALGLQWWIAGLAPGFTSHIAVALVAGPVSTAATISIVVVVVSATGWFIERSRRRPIA